jgi:hypothetical protein
LLFFSGKKTLALGCAEPQSALLSQVGALSYQKTETMQQSGGPAILILA